MKGHENILALYLIPATIYFMLHKNYAFYFFILVLIAGIFFLYKSKNQTAISAINNSSETRETAKILNTYSSTLSINYLRNLEIDSPALFIEEILSDGSNYKRYIASYSSSGNKIYGLLTVPNEEVPEGGFSAIVFNHGYIQPTQYKTLEKYVSYVDFLARNGFVVFKIDMRGHGNSEGIATGSYFSSGYTIDAISALKSLQKLDYVNAQKIGMWGHSMAGNLVLRASLVEPDVKALVIWAGAVYSYEDFVKYRLNDGSYVRRQTDPHYNSQDLVEKDQQEIRKIRENSLEVNFNDEFWSSISLTKNIKYLNAPIQFHHAINDTVVNIGYAKDLAEVLKAQNKIYELHEYKGGGHNIDSPYFEDAMQKTVEFFKGNL